MFNLPFSTFGCRGVSLWSKPAQRSGCPEQAEEEEREEEEEGEEEEEEVGKQRPGGIFLKP